MVGAPPEAGGPGDAPPQAHADDPAEAATDHPAEAAADHHDDPAEAAADHHDDDHVDVDVDDDDHYIHYDHHHDRGCRAARHHGCRWPDTPDRSPLMNLGDPRIRIGVDAVATVSCALAAVLTLADIRSPVRSGLTALALVLGTGWAATCWIGIRDSAFAATVAIATGVSIVCFYALVFVEIHWWHPVGSVGALLIVAAVVNAAATARDLTRRSDA